MKTKNVIIFLLVGTLLAVAGTLFYLAGKRAGINGAATATTAVPGKTPLYWQDPMAPGQRFDKPGKSPFMDMPLVPVYAEGAGDDGQVAIGARMQQNLGVRTGAVVRRPIMAAMSAVGSVAYNERDMVLVQARSGGYVERLHVRAALDPVRKGQPLVELFVPDWVAAQEEYLATRRIPGAATDGLTSAARQRMLLAGMDAGQVRQVEASGKVQSRMTIHAPVDGVVAELLVRDGMTVAAGTPLFRINGVASVWVNAEVPEAGAGAVRLGAAVEARIPALKGQVFAGKVSALLPEVNLATRTLKARIELANPGRQLVPGMFANLTFKQAGTGAVLLVPSEAVIKTGRRSVVIVALGGGGFAPVEVETGAEAGDNTEIRTGLQEGQKVVLSGQFLIDSEASLRGAVSRMAETPVALPATPVHHAVGKIEKIDSGEITISHGAVASLQWSAMTMGFKAPAGGMPAGVKVGDRVAFSFTKGEDGAFTIVTLAPATANGETK
ncbi:efflux RND transporter periplasmic adaptor subunit [Massilia sp. TWP1-3-3]|uniref:efflux RND transporter periplasmic adaptor subunit n=1 Tax=Massilia sp. TWP1-3-3 TaxID=2804573 RepID=UPI003CEB5E9C